MPITRSDDPVPQRRRAFRIVAIAYGAALVAAIAAALSTSTIHPIATAWWADVAATVAVFAFSLAYRNSSFYDPYWSLAPLALLAYWLLCPTLFAGNPARTVMVCGLVALWSLRLTHNWARGWSGLQHEDWRYVDLQRQTGAFYWAVSFLGIHLMPTALVFLGCLPAYVALSSADAPFGLIDALATFVTAASIWLEGESDNQLRRYRLSNPAEGSFLASGLWSRIRHPNYLGEIGFWWGLYLFGLAADRAAWWTLAGPVAITLLFRFASLRLIDTRMQQRRPGYAEHMQRVPALLPHLRHHSMVKSTSSTANDPESSSS